MADQNAEVPGPLNLLRPFLLLAYSAYYIVPTIVSLLLNFQISTLLSFDRFKDAWFARFWAWFGPRARERVAPAVMPLLQNAASGVCLDIGPGTGQWVSLFARAENPKITKIYGVEPNVGMHKILQENATEAGLNYEIVGCGAQELQAHGFQPESIDTICTVQCLCSIPGPEKIIKELYPLLKPGGKWIVFEHVKTKYQGSFVGHWQRLINIIWPHFLNGCDITRPTDQWLIDAGEWEDVDLKPTAGEGPYDTIPHVQGTLTKKR